MQVKKKTYQNSSQGKSLEKQRHTHSHLKKDNYKKEKTLKETLIGFLAIFFSWSIYIKNYN